MTRSLLALSVALCCTTSGAQSQEQEPVYYLGGEFGQHDVDAWAGIANIGAGITLDALLELSGKNAFGLEFGRQREKSRWELEYQRGQFDVVGVDLGPLLGQKTDASGNYQALTLNAYREFRWSERFQAFLGLGIGLGQSELPQLIFANSCNCLNTADNRGFVYQGRLGLEYRFSESGRLGVQFNRLMNLPGPESADAAPGVIYDDRDIDTVSLTLRFLW